MRVIISKISILFVSLVFIICLFTLGIGTSITGRADSYVLTNVASFDCTETYTVRVYHDRLWWIQIYCADSNTLISEYIDPDQ